MEIRVFMTPSEMMDRGMWEEFCRVTETNPYAVAEGQMDSYSAIEMPHDMIGWCLREARERVHTRPLPKKN